MRSARFVSPRPPPAGGKPPLRSHPVKRLRIPHVAPVQLIRRRSAQRLIDRRHPPRIVRRLRAHRPVAAEHHAINPKALHEVVDLRLQIGPRPLRLIPLRRQAAQLAPHIVHPRPLAQFRAPRIEPSRPDVGLRAMIEPKAHRRKLAHEGDRRGQIAVADAEVETQPVRRPPLHAAHELGLPTTGSASD